MLLLAVDIECGDGIVRAYRGVNEDVGIEYTFVVAACVVAVVGRVFWSLDIELCCLLLIWSVADGS